VASSSRTLFRSPSEFRSEVTASDYSDFTPD
jgi:hypothetical protein